MTTVSLCRPSARLWDGSKGLATVCSRDEAILLGPCKTLANSEQMQFDIYVTANNKNHLTSCIQNDVLVWWGIEHLTVKIEREKNTQARILQRSRLKHMDQLPCMYAWSNLMVVFEKPVTKAFFLLAFTLQNRCFDWLTISLHVFSIGKSPRVCSALQSIKGPKVHDPDWRRQASCLGTSTYKQADPSIRHQWQRQGPTSLTCCCFGHLFFNSPAWPWQSPESKVSAR